MFLASSNGADDTTGIYISLHISDDISEEYEERMIGELGSYIPWSIMQN